MHHVAEVDPSLESLGAAIRARAAEIHDCGVTAVFVYGSRARRDNRPDSDLDIFVDYDQAGRFSLLKHARIKLLIEQATGLPVHVTTANSIPHSSMAGMSREAVKVL